MKSTIKLTVKYIFLFLVIVNSAYSQSWTKLTAPYNYTLNSCWVDESVPDNGWFIGWRLAGADPISYGYKTTDGGNSFSFSNFSYYFWLAQDIYFVNQNNGVAVGGGIIKTYDGGNSWNVTIDNIQLRGWMYDLMFKDINTGYSVGQTYDYSYTSFWGVLYKTTDGGTSWNNFVITQENQGQNTEFHSVYSTGVGIVYAGGINNSATNSLFKSTDDGITWNALNFYYDVNSLWFSSPDTGYAATNLGISKTTNAGLTWNNILSASQKLYSIDIKNLLGFAIGSNGVIYKTTDRGASWILMTSPVTGQTLNKVFVVNNALAYAVGTGGTILKYQDTPLGIEQENNTPKSFSLSQNYPNPFNPSTTIKFTVAKQENVKLTVMNELGQEVATIENKQYNPGSYEVKWDASNQSSGVYFYRISTPSFSETKRMLMVK